MTLLIVFVSQFASVFLLGLQSRNVNQRRYVAAVVTSFLISISQFVFIRVAATGDVILFVSMAAGGCLGIATSIWFYDRFMQPKPVEPKGDFFAVKMAVLKS